MMDSRNGASENGFSSEIRAIVSDMGEATAPDTVAWLELVAANSEALESQGEELTTSDLIFLLIPALANLENRITELGG